MDLVLFQANCWIKGALTCWFGPWYVLNDTSPPPLILEISNLLLLFENAACFCLSAFMFLLLPLLSTEGFTLHKQGSVPLLHTHKGSSLQPDYSEEQRLGRRCWNVGMKGTDHVLIFLLLDSIVSSTSWGCTRGSPRAWHPWRYMRSVAGSGQAIIHAFLLTGTMARCRSLQEWALGDGFPTCGGCTVWKCILKCFTSTPAFYALLSYYLRWRALFGCHTVHDLVWFDFG